MKKILFTIASLCMLQSSYAQDTAFVVRKSFTFGINGLNGITGNGATSGGLLLRVYKSQKWANRWGLFASGSNTPKKISGSENFVSEGGSQAVAVAFSFGKELHFLKKGKFDLYSFLDALITLDKQYKYSKGVISDSLISGIFYPENSGNYTFRLKSAGDNFEYNTETTKIGVGLTPGIGFNYFLLPWFSIGAEISYGAYLYPQNNTVESGKGQYLKKAYYYSYHINNDYSLNFGNVRALITCQVFFK